MSCFHLKSWEHCFKVFFKYFNLTKVAMKKNKSSIKTPNNRAHAKENVAHKNLAKDLTLVASAAADVQIDARIDKLADTKLKHKQAKDNAHDDLQSGLTSNDVFAAIDKELSDTDTARFFSDASGDASASANATRDNRGDKAATPVHRGRHYGDYLPWIGGGLLLGGAAAALAGGGDGGGGSPSAPAPTPGVINDFHSFCANAVTSNQALTGLKTINVTHTNVPLALFDLTIDSGVDRPHNVSPTSFLNNNTYHVTSNPSLAGTTINPAGVEVHVATSYDYSGIDALQAAVNVLLSTTEVGDDKVIWMHDVAITTTNDTSVTTNVDGIVSIHAFASNESNAEIGICDVNVDIQARQNATARANVFASATNGHADVIIGDLTVRAANYNGSNVSWESREANVNNAIAAVSGLEAYAEDSAYASLEIGNIQVTAQAGYTSDAHSATDSFSAAAVATLARVDYYNGSSATVDGRILAEAISSSESHITIDSLKLSASATGYAYSTATHNAYAEMAYSGLGQQNVDASDIHSINGGFRADASDNANATISVNSATLSAYVGHESPGGHAVAAMAAVNSAYSLSSFRQVLATINASASANASNLDSAPDSSRFTEAHVSIGELNINAMTEAYSSEAIATMAWGSEDSPTYTLANIQAYLYGSPDYVVTDHFARRRNGDSVNNPTTEDYEQAGNVTVTIGDINIAASAENANSDAVAGMAIDGVITRAGIYASASFSSSDADHTATVTINDINVSANTSGPHTEAYAVLAANAVNANNMSIDAAAQYNGEAAVDIQNINVSATTGLPNQDYYDASGFAAAGLAGGFISQRNEVYIGASAEDESSANLSIGEINITATSQFSEGTGDNHSFFNGNHDSALAFMAGSADYTNQVQISASATSTGAEAHVSIDEINIKATSENSATAFVAGRTHGLSSNYAMLSLEATASGGVASLELGQLNVNATGSSANAALIFDSESDNDVYQDIYIQANADNSGLANTHITQIAVSADATGSASAALISGNHNDADYNSAFVGIESSASSDANANIDIGLIKVNALGANSAEAMMVGNLYGLWDTDARLRVESNAYSQATSTVNIDKIEVSAQAESDYWTHANAYLVGNINDGTRYGDASFAGVDFKAYSSGYSGNEIAPDANAHLHIGDVAITAMSNQPTDLGYISGPPNFNVAEAFMAGQVEGGSAAVMIEAVARASKASVAIDTIAITAESHQFQVPGGDGNSNTFGGAFAFMAGQGEDSNVVNIHASANDAPRTTGYQNESSVTIGSIDIKASSDVSDYSFGPYSGGEIAAFVAGASGYGNGATFSIAAEINDANDQSVANVHIGSIDVAATAESGFRGESVLASLVHTAYASFIGDHSYNSGNLNIYADLTEQATDSSAYVHIDSISVKASNENALIYDGLNVSNLHANLVDADYAHVDIGTHVDGYGFDNKATLNIDEIKVKAEGTAYFIQAGLAYGSYSAHVDIAAENYNSPVNDQSDVTIGSISVSAYADNNILGSYVADAHLALAQSTASFAIKADVDVSHNISPPTFVRSEASVHIDEINVKVDSDSLIASAGLVSAGDSAFGEITAHGDSGNAEVTVVDISVESNGIITSRAHLVEAYNSGYDGLALQAISAYVSTEGMDYHAGNASVSIDSIDIKAEVTGIEAFDNIGPFGGSGYVVASLVDSGALNRVAIEAYTTHYAVNAEASVYIGDISVSAINHANNDQQVSHYVSPYTNYQNLYITGAEAGLAIAAYETSGYSVSLQENNLNPMSFNRHAEASASVDINASAYNNTHTDVTIDNISISATSGANSALATMAGESYAFNNATTVSYPTGTLPNHEDKNVAFHLNTYATAYAEVNVSSVARDAAHATVTIGDIDVTATSTGEGNVLAGIAVNAYASDYNRATIWGHSSDYAVVTNYVETSSQVEATVWANLVADASDSSYANLTIDSIHIEANANPSMPSNGTRAIAGIAYDAAAHSSAYAYAGSDENASSFAHSDAYANAQVNMVATASEYAHANTTIGQVEITANGVSGAYAVGAGFANATAYAASGGQRTGSGAANAYAEAEARAVFTVYAEAQNYASANLNIGSIELNANNLTTGDAVAALAYDAHANSYGNPGDPENSNANARLGGYAYGYGNVDVNIGYQTEIVDNVSVGVPSVGISLVAENQGHGDALAVMAANGEDVLAEIKSFANNSGDANVSMGNLDIKATAADGDAYAFMAFSGSSVEARILAYASDSGHASLTMQGIDIEATSLDHGEARAQLAGNYGTGTAYIASWAHDSGIATLTINEGITLKADAYDGDATAGFGDFNGVATIGVDITDYFMVGIHSSGIQAISIDEGKSYININGDIDVTADSVVGYATAYVGSIAANAFGDGGEALSQVTIQGDINVKASSSIESATAYIGAISAYATNSGTAIMHILGDINISATAGTELDDTADAHLRIYAGATDTAIASLTIDGSVKVSASGLGSGDVSLAIQADSDNSSYASFNIGDVYLTNDTVRSDGTDLSLGIDNFYGEISRVGDIHINLNDNLYGQANIGGDSDGSSHHIGYGDMYADLGDDSQLDITINQQYVTSSSASRELTITGGSADVSLNITGPSDGGLASYGFNEINLDEQTRFDLIINDAGDGNVYGDEAALLFGNVSDPNSFVTHSGVPTTTWGAIDGYGSGVSFVRISNFDENDTITFNNVDTYDDVDEEDDLLSGYSLDQLFHDSSFGNDGFISLYNADNGHAETNLDELWSNIQGAIDGMRDYNHDTAGFVYSVFHEKEGESIDGGDVAGVGGRDIGVLAYSAQNEGITSVIFFENPIDLNASQIYINVV